VEVARAAAVAGGVEIEVRVDDAYALHEPDGAFDIVHAHQVLQHLADPVAALAEWRRVCAPGGVVAARDADYEVFCWHPADPLLTRWLSIYREVARRNGGEPDAARHLVQWAHAAGFTDVTASTSAWCFADPEDRAWWGETWAERISSTTLATQAVDHGLATAGELADIAGAWRRWVDEPDGWFAVLHGEILCRR
jgi:SAM-dependent methyltransferase